MIEQKAISQNLVSTICTEINPWSSLRWAITTVTTSSLYFDFQKIRAGDALHTSEKPICIAKQIVPRTQGPLQVPNWTRGV